MICPALRRLFLEHVDGRIRFKILLASQDYALLLGSLPLFAVLGAIRMLTRKVDWNSVFGQE